MNNLFYLLPITIFLLVCCSEAPPPAKTEPAPEPVVADSSHTTASKPSKVTWTMELESNGIIIFGNKATTLVNLQKVLIDSIKNCRNNHLALPDTIVYTSKGEVLMGVRGSVLDAIDQSLAEAKK